MLRLVVVAVGLSFAATSCGDDPCVDPDHTLYDCEPIHAGPCAGSPPYLRDGATTRDDLDKTYPAGCTARVPQCTGPSRGERDAFECQPNGGWAALL